MSAILVITSKRDGHVAPVTQHFEAVGQPWVRLNVEDVPRNLRLTLDPTVGRGRAELLDSGREFVIQDVCAVWYRKPDPLDLSHFSLDPDALDYVEAEFVEILQGLYGLLRGATWINDPLTTRLAHRKLMQLRVANRIGFRTPRTIVTNDPEAALSFAESVGWDLAIKSLGALAVTQNHGERMIQYGVYTRRVTKDDLLSQRHRIQLMPTVFQEYIHKAYELRVTCVGRRAFCCRIDSQATPESSEDFRFNVHNLAHELVQCPAIEPKLAAYLHALGLNFGCFDIAVTSQGEYVFFECNPNGQWLWIEQLTGAPIGETIAKLLMDGSVTSSEHPPFPSSPRMPPAAADPHTSGAVST